jgi:flagellar biosynthesis protein FlhF
MKPVPPHPNPKVVPFIAESAADAVAQIRAQLGPDAVVLNVRQLPADGLSRLWKGPRIEVLACKPEPAEPGAPAAPAPDPLAELKQELAAIRRQLTPASGAAAHSSLLTSHSSPGRGARAAGPAGWRVGEVLESSGLMPWHASRVVEQIRSRHGEAPPGTLAEELALARSALASLWQSAPATRTEDRLPHVLVGPAGAGKTTSLCKWLAQARLNEGRAARVWRLDGLGANTAEALSVYCDILGVPAERAWAGPEAALSDDLKLVDVPGVDWRHPAAVAELKRLLDDLGPARLHLVLNAAYEVPLLLAQARAFAALPIEDLIFTHLDEEPRWGKMWNVVLGANLPVRYLSAARNVPGEFFPATAEKILSRQFSA